MPSLFDKPEQAAGHDYLDPDSQQRLPSVTRICEVAWPERIRYPATAAARGQQRHSEVAAAIAAQMRGEPVARTGVGGSALQLLSALGMRPVYVEQVMYSTARGYAGRVDLVAEIAGNYIIIDWKGSSRHPAYALQVAGYAQLASEILGVAVTRGLLIHWVPRSRNWAPEPNRDAADYRIAQADLDTFNACLALWHWRQQRLEEKT